MSDIDDEEKLRMSDDEDRDDFERQEEPAGSSGAVVLAYTFTDSSYPTSDGVFFACNTLSITGDETEGASGVTSNLADVFYAYLPVGSAIPPDGTEVVCVYVNYRWVIVY